MTVRGIKYSVEDGKLDLSDIELVAITEIEGLETLTNLQKLYIHKNQIKEIKGLRTIKKVVWDQVFVQP